MVRPDFRGVVLCSAGLADHGKTATRYPSASAKNEVEVANLSQKGEQQMEELKKIKEIIEESQKPGTALDCVEAMAQITEALNPPGDSYRFTITTTKVKEFQAGSLEEALTKAEADLSSGHFTDDYDELDWQQIDWELSESVTRYKAPDFSETYEMKWK